MERQQVHLKTALSRFATAVRNLAQSEVGGRAKLIFAVLITLLCGVAVLNVVNSYVGRNFMTAIAQKQPSAFFTQAVLYIGVFAAMTGVSVVARFAEERLALLWREFLTRRSVTLYMADRTYYRLDASGELTHPDQRIADDVRAFTVTTLSFVLMIFNSSLTMVSFSGVLWTISPLLFVVAVLYAAAGSYLTILLGRPLIGLNYDQLDKEASFRSGLIRVRENAEPILVARAEKRQTALLLDRLDSLIGNFRRITSINRNVGFFTTGYNWMIQIIPALIVAPAFFAGRIEFGVITQSAAAFAMLVAAFSLIITQFQSISNFAAVVARLGLLIEAIEKSQKDGVGRIDLIERPGPLAFEGVTVKTAKDAVLVRDLSLVLPERGGTLLRSADEAAGTALFRAVAGVPTTGSGRILTAESTRFLTQRPYLPSATLREVLWGEEGEAGDAPRLDELLATLDLDHVVRSAGGLDVEQDWRSLLSLGEQQLIAIAAAVLQRAKLVFLDRVDMSLSGERMNQIVELLDRNGIAWVSHGAFEPATSIVARLTLDGTGGWSWQPP